MKTFLIIIGVIAVVYLLWDFFFGKAYREKRDEHLLWRFVEDNMFRLSSIVDLINSCTSIEELKKFEPWINKQTEALAKIIACEAESNEYVKGSYRSRVSDGIIQTIKEKYDEKLNSL